MKARLAIVLAHPRARLYAWSLTLLLYVLWMRRALWVPKDYDQQSSAIVALIHLHLSAVYPANTPITSPPGFLILAAPIVALFGGNPTGGLTGPSVGMLSTLFVAAAAVRLTRLLRPAPSLGREWLLVVGLLLGTPFTDATVGAYHPEDLVALGFILLSMHAAIRHQPLAVGLSLAAAVLTRQWAILAVGPILIYTGIGWRRAVGLGVLLVAAILTPFALLEPAGLLRALTANSGVTISNFSIWRDLTLGTSTTYALARIAPIACCVPTIFLLHRRWRRSSPSRMQLLGALILCFSYRPMFDTAALPYYVGPVVCLLLVAGVCDLNRGRFLASIAVVVLIQLLLSDERPLDGHFALPSSRQMILIASMLQLAFVACAAVGCLLVAKSGEPAAATKSSRARPRQSLHPVAHRAVEGQTAA